MPRPKKPNRAAPRGRGRPPKPAAEVKSVVVHVRLTAAEHDAACQAATAAGLTLSDFVRLLLSSAAS